MNSCYSSRFQSKQKLAERTTSGLYYWIIVTKVIVMRVLLSKVVLLKVELLKVILTKVVLTEIVLTVQGLYS